MTTASKGNLLSGLVRCGRCGKPLHLHKGSYRCKPAPRYRSISRGIYRGISQVARAVWDTVARLARFRRFALPNAWKGVLAPLDTPSVDGRIIATPPELRVRGAAQPLVGMPPFAPHGVPVGMITLARMNPGVLTGQGTLDLSTREGRRVARRLAGAGSLPIGIDLDIDDDHYDEAAGTLAAVDWRLIGAHIHDRPAFPVSRIVPMWVDPDPVDDLGAVQRLVDNLRAGGDGTFVIHPDTPNGPTP